MPRPTLAGVLLTAWVSVVVGSVESGASAGGSAPNASAGQNHSSGLRSARDARAPEASSAPLPVSASPRDVNGTSASHRAGRTNASAFHGHRAGRRNASASHRGRGGRMNVSGSASCAALGITYLTRVPVVERRPRTIRHLHGQGASWLRGHYPWPVCGNTSQRHSAAATAPAGISASVVAAPPPAPRPPLTVLMVADSTYSVRIPAWASLVHSFRASCAVGDVGDASEVRRTSQHTPTPGSAAAASSSPTASSAPAPSSSPAFSAACTAAEAAGCECFAPPSRAKAHSLRADVNGAVALAVRWRFKFALALLRRGNEVLMHDADVFFSVPGMLATLRFAAAERDRAAAAAGASHISASTSGRGSTAAHGSGATAPQAPELGAHFVLQPNGERREAFDDLNWGFVWMRAAPVTAQLLKCALDTWNHRAFRGPPLPARSWYHARSQPRLNHILEAAISSARTPAAEPRACMLPRGLFYVWGARDRPWSLGTSPGEERAVVHFTGFETPQRKLFCAKAEGLLLPASAHSPPEREAPATHRQRARASTPPPSVARAPPPILQSTPPPVLSYSPPVGATVEAQGRALAAAYALAARLHAMVGLPPAALMLRTSIARHETPDHIAPYSSRSATADPARHEEHSSAEPANAEQANPEPASTEHAHAAHSSAEHAGTEPSTPEFVPLCRLIDVETLPMEQTVAPPLLPDGSPACGNGAKLLDVAALAGQGAVYSRTSPTAFAHAAAWGAAAAFAGNVSRVVTSLAAAPGAQGGAGAGKGGAGQGGAGQGVTGATLWCVDFDSLLGYANASGERDGVRPLYTCDPWHPAVTSRHACAADKYSLAIGAGLAPGDNRTAEAAGGGAAHTGEQRGARRLRQQPTRASRRARAADSRGIWP
jgi:hypothetical protein